MDEYPLDPLPYRCGLKRPVDDVRHPERDVWSCSDPIFEPRPGYEKSRAAYGLSDDSHPPIAIDPNDEARLIADAKAAGFRPSRLSQDLAAPLTASDEGQPA